MSIENNGILPFPDIRNKFRASFLPIEELEVSFEKCFVVKQCHMNINIQDYARNNKQSEELHIDVSCSEMNLGSCLQPGSTVILFFLLFIYACIVEIIQLV